MELRPLSRVLAVDLVLLSQWWAEWLGAVRQPGKGSQVTLLPQYRVGSKHLGASPGPEPPVHSSLGAAPHWDLQVQATQPLPVESGPLPAAEWRSEQKPASRH